MKLDPQIDALYQLPLEQFTEKRNALVKDLSGAPKKQVRFLTKPPLPIWAVNQLYWNDRATYNALIDASEKLRAAHRSALSGHKADIRKTEQIHRAALETAVAKTVALLTQAQGQVSDAARDTIRKALSALPNDEAPGRLTRVPEAAGFSLLTGIKPRETREEPTAREEPKKDRVLARATAAQLRAEQARQEQVRRDLAKAIAAAERDLQRARKAAEESKFRTRTLTAELQKAQAAEVTLAAAVSTAEQKVAELRTPQESGGSLSKFDPDPKKPRVR